MYLPSKLILTLNPQIDETETTGEKRMMTVGTVEAIATETETTNEERSEDENGETTEEIPHGKTTRIHLLAMIGVPRVLDHQLRQTVSMGAHPTKVHSSFNSRRNRSLTPLITFSEPPKHASSTGRPNLDPDASDSNEDGEAMEDIDDEDAAMMAMMGVTGFGTTKVNTLPISGFCPLIY
jgi:hypothetical protein